MYVYIYTHVRFLFEMQYLYTNMTKLQFIYVYVCIHIYRNIYVSTAQSDPNSSHFFSGDATIICETTFDN